MLYKSIVYYEWQGARPTVSILGGLGSFHSPVSLLVALVYIGFLSCWQTNTQLLCAVVASVHTNRVRLDLQGRKGLVRPSPRSAVTVHCGRRCAQESTVEGSRLEGDKQTIIAKHLKLIIICRAQGCIRRNVRLCDHASWIHSTMLQ